ncbi:tRNA uridine-5-carboxymethylaminomethyl(34) synthesis GTPase MnmE [Ponticoccus alexandrii]|uniref:tRNA modification GTPase MnmE n=1 Tax=Ponticoccus alexandrii TaxID=1943633 RepID=A0ABX7FDI1_9RHOB|nr:tRNA uridine-5-carboxymethylaminomethyl(34) synthesis GTPase MnmE [Ponticoccus alexandrii]ETA52998.1 tRNA modification GTPase TrmE [Rhodobacteraceae bacterium PD-2]QRF68282.1 tRNA uridine-5-carboxymethylaminomethyl(34) synthesis GTPase MnmE [Ponticoccus alexandrii]
MDTIYALASAPGRAGVSIVRLSGPHAWEVVERLATPLPAPRQAALRVLRDQDGAFLDQALVLLFEDGRSFTGERIAEFHLHGSIAVQRAVLRAISVLPGLRLAEPGEFTRRALETGSMDLTQVEGLSDLIDAETEVQRQQALKVLSGDLGARVHDWRRSLVRAASLLEATIDFADEDVPVDVSDEVRDLVTSVLTEVKAELAGLTVAERIRTGFEVAIVGPPNAGKSTLLNHLAGREAAITSEVAGTTRDVLEVRMDINGLPVVVLDTAGLRETTDTVEAIGVARARARADEADLRVHLVPAGEAPIIEVRPGDLVLTAKQDSPVDGVNGISGQTGHGVEALQRHIQETLAERVQRVSLSSRERHRMMLEDGGTLLADALGLLQDGPDLYDVVSENVRVAARRMESLLGYVDVEHLLDEIFANFCVGK